MKLTTKEDIEAPVAFVSAALTDFEMWERAAMRRGADVERLDRLRQPGPGMQWRVAFDYRGKQRKLEIKVLTLEPEQAVSFHGSSKPAEGVLTIEITEMGPRRTRLVANMEVTPRTLAARLFLQSLKLAKAKVTRRFALRLSQVGADIEDRYRNQAKA
jgi:succinylglutamate desuccinylase